MRLAQVSTGGPPARDARKIGLVGAVRPHNVDGRRDRGKADSMSGDPMNIGDDDEMTPDEIWRAKRNARDAGQDYDFDDRVTYKPGSHKDTLMLIETRQARLLTTSEVKHARAITQSSRIKGMTAKDRKAEGLEKHEAGSGHHEWIPTDLFVEVLQAPGRHWSLLFWYMRTPTWLLIVNPARFHAHQQNYLQQIEKAEGYSEAKSPFHVNASELNLVGHSNGLSLPRANAGNKQLTTFQQTWHDELRSLFRKYKDGTDYAGWVKDLNAYISRTFLFVDGIDLPGHNDAQVSTEATLSAIRWDLSLTTDKGEPCPPGATNMLQVAAFMHGQWKYWHGVLNQNLKLIEFS